MRGRQLLAAAPLAGLLLLAAEAPGGSFPRLDWDSRGGIDWSSGYVIAYGSAAEPPGIVNAALRRAAGQRAAHREATRSLLRMCFDLTIQERLSLRDYLKEDEVLREALRERTAGLPPWSVKLEGGLVQVAVRLPLGGDEGLSAMLGSLQSFAAEGADAPRAGGSSPVPLFSGREATGIVLLAERALLLPALRPRVLDGEGRELATWERAGEEARARPAFVSYYASLASALKDPEVGAEPLVVPADQSGGAGTDIVLPAAVAYELFRSPRGRDILRGVRIAVVLQ